MKKLIFIISLLSILNNSVAEDCNCHLQQILLYPETYDTINSANAHKDYERWEQSQFSIAGSPRYTITGDLPYKETHIKPLNFWLFTGTLGVFMYYQHKLQMETIWKEQGNFKIQEDGKYAMYADKAGHIFGCYLTSYFMTEGFLQSGLSWETATIVGTTLGLSYSAYVEVLDGYGKQWGFSPSDFYADVAGAALHIGQFYLPYLQNFTPKFMYFPANWHNEQKRYPHDMFIDDYSSHTLWLSANIKNMLPEKVGKYIPPWLELSFGYAVRGLCDTLQASMGKCKPCSGDRWVDGFYFGSPRYIIALDYNLIHLLPEGGKFWNWLRQTLNYFKLPSPAIEFGRVTKVYLLYPFHFKIKK
jgi:hypothetical protein